MRSPHSTQGPKFFDCLCDARRIIGGFPFSALGDLWLEGNQIILGVNTVSGPMIISGLSNMIQPADHAMPKFLVPSQPKCRPSRPIPMVGSEKNGILTEISDSVQSSTDIPQSQEYFYTTPVIHSTRETAILPFNISLGLIRSMQNVDHKVLESATKFTASQVTNNFFALPVKPHINSDPYYDHASAHVQTRSPNTLNCTHDPKFSHAQETPQDKLSGLGSSILPLYLASPELDNDKAFPFTGTGECSIQPFSDEFFYKLLRSLELKAHVPSSILEQFKSLLYKNQNLLHLPDSPLSTIKGYSHKIPTGNFPPVYRIPYCKIPAELAAIRQK